MSVENITICPGCGHENIAGADACSSCNWDLTQMDKPEGNSRLERHIMAAGLEELELDPPLLVEPSATLGEVVELLANHGKGCVLVRSGSGSVAGIFGERDILLKHAHREDGWRSERVGDHMIHEPITLQASATIAHALNKMDIGDYRHIPVLDEDDKPVGILSIKAILRHLHEWLEEN